MHAVVPRAGARDRRGDRAPARRRVLGLGNARDRAAPRLHPARSSGGRATPTSPSSPRCWRADERGRTRGARRRGRAAGVLPGRAHGSTCATRRRSTPSPIPIDGLGRTRGAGLRRGDDAPVQRGSRLPLRALEPGRAGRVRRRPRRRLRRPRPRRARGARTPGGAARRRGRAAFVFDGTEHSDRDPLPRRARASAPSSKGPLDRRGGNGDDRRPARLHPHGRHATGCSSIRPARRHR